MLKKNSRRYGIKVDTKSIDVYGYNPNKRGDIGNALKSAFKNASAGALFLVSLWKESNYGHVKKLCYTVHNRPC